MIDDTHKTMHAHIEKNPFLWNEKYIVRLPYQKSTINLQEHWDKPQ